MHAFAVFLAVGASVLACLSLVTAEGDKWQPEIPPEVCIRAYFGPWCISRKQRSVRNYVNLYECMTPGLSKWKFELVDSTPKEGGALYNIKDTKTGYCLYPNPLGGGIANGTAVSERSCDKLSYDQKTWFVQWCAGHRKGWTYQHKKTGLWLAYSGLVKDKFYRPVLSTIKTFWRMKFHDRWVGINTL